MVCHWKQAVGAALLTLTVGLPAIADEAPAKAKPTRAKGSEVRVDSIPPVDAGGATAKAKGKATITIQAEAAEAEPAKPSYWIGAMCFPARAALRAQLNLPKAQGIVVMTVIDGGPAAKAGIQKHDVLLTANDAPLKNVRSLGKIVTESEGKQLTIVLLRAGERQTVHVTPNQRPQQPERVVVAPDAMQQEALQEWIQQLAPNVKMLPQGHQRLRLRFMQPGRVVGKGRIEAHWPKNLNVTIMREGDQPVKIRVQQDGKEWTLDRKELGTLPEKLLPFVERMLGNGGAPKLPGDAIEIDMPKIEFTPAAPEAKFEKSDAAESPPEIAKPRNLKADLPQSLDDLNQKLLELQKQLQAIEEDQKN